LIGRFSGDLAGREASRTTWMAKKGGRASSAAADPALHSKRNKKTVFDIQ